jgi:tripeptide aminopeptidase
MDKNKLINTFLEIVQIDSPTGHEKNMADYVFTRLSVLGLSPIYDSYGNVIAKMVSGGEPIILTAHLDTVEPGRGIKPLIVDGLIKSSGDTILGADNKVGVAVILNLLEILVSKKINVSLEIIFTLSEEVGNLGAVNLDYSLISGKCGYSFDTIGPLGEITTAAPFYNRFDIEVLGKAVHAGRPQKGINALKIFSNAIHKIKLGKIDEDTVCNIGFVEGGSVRNTVPGRIFIKGEVRSFVENKLEKETTKIINNFKSAAATLGGKVVVDVVSENGGYKLSKNNPVIQHLAHVMESQNIKPRFKQTLGCADSNIFCDHGITVVNMSDGSEKPHTVDESISVENLTKLSNLIFGLVSKG